MLRDKGTNVNMSSGRDQEETIEELQGKVVSPISKPTVLKKLVKEE